MIISFWGFVYSDSIVRQYLHNSVFYDFAGNNFQRTLIKGLSQLSQLSVVAAPNLVPQKGKYIKQSEFILADCDSVTGSSIGYYNCHGLKQFILPYKYYREYKRSGVEPDVIIVYAADSSRLKAAIKVKKHNPSVKIVVIVADLPEFMSPSENKIYRFLKGIDQRYIDKYLKYVDGYILLTELMKYKLPVNEKPYIVIEGISDGVTYDSIADKPYKNDKILLYTGTLSERFGIRLLLDAFKNIDRSEVKLMLCGDGDCVELINKESSRDSRIVYLGKLPKQEIIKLQTCATLLVNPRLPEGEYTKYSFPSKTMEYFVSGTPCLLYKLQGIPKEYFDYCFTLESSEVSELTNKISSILDLPDSILNEVGDKARKFILKNKTVDIQCNKIINFIKNI